MTTDTGAEPSPWECGVHFCDACGDCLALDRPDIVPASAEVGDRQDIVPAPELTCRPDIVPPGAPSTEDSRDGVVAVVDDLAVEGHDHDLAGPDLDDGGDVLVGLVLGDGDALAERSTRRFDRT